MAKETDNRRDEDIQYLIKEMQELKERDSMRQVEMEELKEKVEDLEDDNQDLYDANAILEKKVKTLELRRSKRISAKAVGKTVGKGAKAVFGLGLGLGSNKKK